jgi:invasion protein IalB
LVGNAPVTATLPFRTCLPIGCVVGITADAKLLASLRTGSSLQVKAAAVEGKETDFTISLKGFAAGYDRIVQLLK